MVKLDAVYAANAALVNTNPFVAVIAGGTAGIGECAVRGLATTFAAHGSQLRIYIVGRNQEAADNIISSCGRICPGGTFQFVGGDLALIKEVDRICDVITVAEQEHAIKSNGRPAKVDFLLCSQGILSTNLEDTEEGIYKICSLTYFSRMRFAVQLLPLLSNAPHGGHVVSVLNGRIKPSIQLDDLGLRKPSSQAIGSMFGHQMGMTNVFISELARRNPGKIALSHVYPGYVITDAADHSEFPWWLKFILKWIVGTLALPITVPHPEVGQRMVYLATDRFSPAPMNIADGAADAEGIDGNKGSGAYRVDSTGETYPQETEYARLRENGGADKIYEYTMKVFEEIQTNGVYKE
ncbi:hypothetical protein HD806DRAFT_531503 [Xylariaceae sp. AK1471]|nr:hypothetical protein HD806DRAFT_531503 [Xylariaceae sp. AK1471]